eukprot:m.7330 g.7330  ORF g.7330 m.7330 type:complete len:369 (+) comp2894_c0_seq2:145-1251(+)
MGSCGLPWVVSATCRQVVCRRFPRACWRQLRCRWLSSSPPVSQQEPQAHTQPQQPTIASDGPLHHVQTLSRAELALVANSCGPSDPPSGPLLQEEDLAAAVEAFQRDGACHLRGVFASWVPLLRQAVEDNMASPGPFAAENVADSGGGDGSFWDDYVNWSRFSTLQRLVFGSPAASIAKALMQSSRAQFFHDHILVKEPGTSKETPWHQDAPYYFVNGRQTVSLWISCDHASEGTLRFIAGSHRWPNLVLPVRWADDSDFYRGATEHYLSVPDPDKPGATDPDGNPMRVIEWTVAPGDVLAFHFQTVHGARGNLAASRRRAVSLRFVGDDARYAERPGSTSPPFHGHGMTNGQVLRDDWFPLVHTAKE